MNNRQPKCCLKCIRLKNHCDSNLPSNIVPVVESVVATKTSIFFEEDKNSMSESCPDGRYRHPRQLAQEIAFNSGPTDVWLGIARFSLLLSSQILIPSLEECYENCTALLTKPLHQQRRRRRQPPPVPTTLTASTKFVNSPKLIPAPSLRIPLAKPSSPDSALMTTSDCSEGSRNSSWIYENIIGFAPKNAASQTSKINHRDACLQVNIVDIPPRTTKRGVLTKDAQTMTDQQRSSLLIDSNCDSLDSNLNTKSIDRKPFVFVCDLTDVVLSGSLSSSTRSILSGKQKNTKNQEKSV